MGFLSWLFLDGIEALVFHWPTWVALILAQAVSLWATPELRWLPSVLLILGVALAMLWPLLHR